MVTKMRVVVVLCFFVGLSSGVSGFPSADEPGDEVQPKEDESPHLQPSRGTKIIHDLLQKLGYLPTLQPDLQPHFQSDPTEGPNAFVSNSTESPDDPSNELWRLASKIALARHFIRHRHDDSSERLLPPSISPAFHFSHDSLPPFIHRVHHEPPSQRFGPIHRYILDHDDFDQKRKSPVQFNVHSGNSPISFERSDKGLSIHLNTKLDLGGIDLAETSHLGPIIINNNIEILLRREEKEPEKEVPKPAEPEYNYDTYTDDEDYFEDSEEGSGNHHTSIVMNDEKGSETVMTSEPTEGVETSTTLI